MQEITKNKIIRGKTISEEVVAIKDKKAPKFQTRVNEF